jgi:hypothetical protein
MTDDIGGPTVSLAEAGAQSHLSVATIRRRLKSGKIPGAVRNDDRSWSIPVASLVTEGIWSGTTDADDQDDAPSAPSAPPPDHAAELAAMRHRAELAEARNELLERSLANAEMSLRMLDAGPQRPRRRWFRSSE